MAHRRRLPQFIDRISLRRGLKVSPFCIGIVRNPTTVSAAVEAGVNFFFVSTDMHWPYYDATRRGLAAFLRGAPRRRDEIVVAAVCYPTQPEFNRMPFEELIDAVPGLQRIDVAVMGGSYANDFMARLPVYLEHRQAAFAGTRAIGATFHDRTAVAPAANHRLIDIAFARYNPGHPGAREDLFPRLSTAARAPLFNFTNTGGLVGAARRKALGLPSGLWAPDVTDYHRFALSRPEIAGLLCSPRTPREVHSLHDALQRGPLSDEEERLLIDLAALDRGDAELAEE